jgi:Flp pilus assembly protein TadG
MGRRVVETRKQERGVSLLVVAGGLVMLLAIAAITIDLGSLYLARDEAQRAADAAALASAKVLADSGCVGSGTCGTVESAATQQAITVGGQNTIGGQSVSMQAGDVSYNIATSQNPRVSVTAQRTAARGNAMPTFFAKIMGFRTADISAVATAEVFNPSGSSGGTIFCTSCVRPWLVGNCDGSHTTPKNSLCSGTQAYLLDANNNYAIANPGLTPAGSIGESMNLQVNSVPSQYRAVDYGGGKSGYSSAIMVCQGLFFTCGNTVDTLTGNVKKPTASAVETLTHANDQGLGQGQDTIDTTVNPFQIHAGSNNPLVTQGVVAANAVISTSDSLITAFVFDGTQLKNGKQTVTIVGFMQAFITQVDSNSDVPAIILNLVGCGNNPQPNNTCGSNANGVGGTTTGGGASLLAVRLVRTQ